MAASLWAAYGLHGVRMPAPFGSIGPVFAALWQDGPDLVLTLRCRHARKGLQNRSRRGARRRLAGRKRSRLRFFAGASPRIVAFDDYLQGQDMALGAKGPRVAIIHYWLVGMRGGERVLERLLRLYPGADIFTHVVRPDRLSDTIRAHRIQTTFIAKLPGAQRFYQHYLPLMPMALEALDLRGYDLVISSEAGPAKGVIAPPDAFHLCYCHSPMRYLWDHFHDYHARAGWLSKRVMPPMFHRLRQWDAISAQRPDRVLANSAFIARRIRKSWGRDATDDGGLPPHWQPRADE